jgi:uncharacterized protein YjbI with pentapeptide repeats
MYERLPESGNLRDTHIIEIFHFIAAEVQTGCLILTQKEIEAKLYFKKGILCSIHSNYMKKLDLGSIFLLKSMITADEYKTLQEKILAGEGRAGEILRVMKGILPADLQRNLRLQARSKLVYIFRWNEGQYTFVAGELPKENIILTGADMFSIVLKSVEQHLPPAFTKKMLEDLKQRKYIRLLESPMDLHGTKLADAEQHVIDLIKNGMHFKDLFLTNSLAMSRMYQILIFLYGIGKIDFSEFPEAPAVAAAPTAVVAESGRKKRLIYNRDEVIQMIKEGKSLENADLVDIDLSNVDLSFAHLVGANLQNARLRFATLKNANLSFANLYNADLSYAKLEGTNFRDAILTSAKLFRAKYAAGTFTESQLDDAVLQEDEDIAAESTKIQYIMTPQLEEKFEKQDRRKIYIAAAAGVVFLLLLLNLFFRHC